MSRATQQRDAVAPSLFPFLAVLLCTMGALVLILMLIVSGAQASALRVVEESEKQTEEVESQLALAAQGFQKQLSAGRLELEKKRLSLQHLEKHAQEILTEIEQLQQTAELAQTEAATDEASLQAQATAISELEQQLLDAQEQLKQKLDKPDGDKPIFAIIPYKGPNGTHRRPIYLECLEEGIRIQPEGVLIRLADLEPPYGPGNPLDAALRTIRSTYVPANLAVTSTAYPLLIVRPSGIRSYAMARAAMSGWDDQFGYELVGEELELVFPEGEPGLAQKIAQALDLARARQAALIMAMPHKYRELANRDAVSLDGSEGAAGGSGGPALGDVTGGSSGASTANGQGWNGSGPAAADGARGGWSDPSTTNLSANNSLNGNSGGAISSGMNLADSGGMLGFGEASPLALDSGNPTSTPGQPNPWGEPSSPSAEAGDSFFGSSTDGSSSLGGREGANLDASQGGSEQPAGSSDSSSSAASQANSQASGGGSPGGSGAAGQPNLTGSQMALPMNAPTAAGSMSAASTNGGQSAPNAATQSTASPGDAQTAPQLSLNQTFGASPSPNESATPVAARKGRGWAWSKGPPSQTCVVRAIRMQCLEDRWVVLADSGHNREQPTTILFDDTPQSRAEKLAKIVADRVDQWGLALAGGYWKPILEVEVAAGAEWRFTQLQQLLASSGLDVQRVPSTPR
jgi:hypothetical protein